ATNQAHILHFLHGTPFVYQGEEIGMTDPYFTDMEQYQDIESHNAYDDLIEKGKTHEEAIEIIQAKSRDNSRTPMQWNDEEHGGFTTGTPWIQVADNYKEINVEKELKDRSEEHTSELQSRFDLVCRLLLEKKKIKKELM